LTITTFNSANNYSIRINDQWRICFRWTTAGPEDVEIVEVNYLPIE
jgi:proteic killer suppression protein